MTEKKFILPKSVIISATAAVLCLVFYIVLTVFKPTVQEVVVLPSGNLTTSIFDAQNMKYRSVVGMDKVMELPGTAYTADGPDGAVAVVEGAQIVLYKDYYFIYDTCAADVAVSDRLKTTLSSVYSMNADPLSTEVRCLASEEGYVNGCSATYSIYQITAGGSDNYICLYELSVSDGKGLSEAGQRVLLGCMASNYTNATLTSLQGVSESLVYTMKYDAKKAEKLGL